MYVPVHVSMCYWYTWLVPCYVQQTLHVDPMVALMLVWRLWRWPNIKQHCPISGAGRASCCGQSISSPHYIMYDVTVEYVSRDTR